MNCCDEYGNCRQGRDCPIRTDTHVWYSNPQWEVDEDGDEFAVSFHTNEVMRLGSDGSLHIGKPKPYMFKTREWAQLCADRLNSLDRAFDTTPSSLVFYGGNLGIGTTSPQYRFHVSSGPTPIVTIDQNHTLTYVNVPYIVKVWLRSTALWRGLKRLWYGERNEQR